MVGMENALHARDRVGVQDFVLLENYQSEEAFVDNLKKRFKENLIYTYIGPVLVSVNPYKSLPIYTPEYVKKYHNVHFCEVPPHVFGVTDNAYSSLREEGHDQCILISGESGSGKTEASKKVLQFIAAATGHKKQVEIVKDKLLQSNPVLEAFGNAKTNRNDNSSRFGKYMDIELNFVGDPVGGHILNYLLEKSRVVHQARGERNFHIFYQLMAGANDELLSKLQLTRNTDSYFYLNQGKSSSVGTLDDGAQFDLVKKAMTVIELHDSEQFDIISIVAAVLHLGNVGYVEENGEAVIQHQNEVDAVAKLLGCPEDVLTKALTHRTIDARGDIVTSPLGREQAVYARDALAKAVYDRLFTWLVKRLNTSLVAQDPGRKTLLGILDIYGFEIFEVNSFEQFCINYCNEKLQQLFIELTLKSEQEEYRREGIEWEPVEFFNNKIICDLIEERHKGMISLMDEECLRPGDPTDMTFLAKMNDTLNGHKHYISNKKNNKTIRINEFRLIHYAGDVTYSVKGFLDKNNDLLFRDLREAMSLTTNKITKEVFPASEMNRKKRPDTAATQFKASLNALMVILMSKDPSYIRCIKPNDFKMAGQFSEEIVTHQVKYLGLMENLRVRRAGFAYRRPYETFLNRYKCLCPDTWPKYKGTPKTGVQKLVNHLKYTKDDYRMGETKIFIRFPKMLFEIEDAFQERKHYLASKIQALWRGYKQRQRYLEMKSSAIVIQKWVRRFLAQAELKRRKQAAMTIRRFIKGFITREGPETIENAVFLGFVRAQYLKRLSKALPKSVLDKSWPRPPHCCKEASSHLQVIHRKLLAHRYCTTISPGRKRQFELKVLAESLFKGEKQGYEKTVSQPFLEIRLSPEQDTLRKNNFEMNVKHSGEKTLYALPVVKYDRHGYKPRDRILIFTDKAVYILDAKNFKLKQRLSNESLIQVITTNSTDNLLVMRIPADMKKDKGDLILQSRYLIETVTRLIDIVKKPELLKIEAAPSIPHYMSSGKTGMIEIKTGDMALISKGRDGHLLVVGSP